MAIAIIQPGKIGDIIICLPIAHYFHRRQEVIWPIHKSLSPMFEAAVDYVKFIAVDSYDLGVSMAAIEPYQSRHAFPLAFGFQGYERVTMSWIETNTYFDE